MALPTYSQLQGQFLDSLADASSFPSTTTYSLPVAVRKEDGVYDAFFMYKGPEKKGAGDLARPFAWALLAADGRPAKSFSWCSAQDFVPTGSFPLEQAISGRLPASLSQAKQKEAFSQGVDAYEKIRLFAFHPDTTVAQLQLIAAYKKIFTDLVPEGLYPFYYALSPDFFDWMRFPLPATGLDVTPVSRDNEILEEVRSLYSYLRRELRGHQEKDALVSDLHEELQTHRNGLLEALTGPLERDVILLIDGLQKNRKTMEDLMLTPESYQKLFTLYKGVEEDLIDVLYRQGVDPYHTQGNQVQIGRQRILSTQPTEEPALDKTVAQRLAPGWEKKGQVVRPEYIRAYLYQEAAASTPDSQSTPSYPPTTDKEMKPSE